jgi:hypothetical protein
MSPDVDHNMHMIRPDRVAHAIAAFRDRRN